MSYRFKFSPAIRNIEDCGWFQTSYESINDWEFRDVDDVDRDYEEKFKVKLIYGEHEDNKGVRPIAAVEFPSEEEATLFFLRWG